MMSGGRCLQGEWSNGGTKRKRPPTLKESMWGPTLALSRNCRLFLPQKFRPTFRITLVSLYFLVPESFFLFSYAWPTAFPNSSPDY